MLESINTLLNCTERKKGEKATVYILIKRKKVSNNKTSDNISIDKIRYKGTT